MTDFFEQFLKTADRLLGEEKPDRSSPAQDAFWDRLVEVCGLGRFATKADVINFVMDARAKLDQTKRDDYWAMLKDILGLGPNALEQEVIDLVKELRLRAGYAKLKADRELELENEELRRQIRVHESTRTDVRDEVRECLKGLRNWSDTYLTDIDNKLSEL